MRLPLPTVGLYHWDSVLYALALSDFNVAESRPAPARLISSTWRPRAWHSSSWVTPTPAWSPSASWAARWRSPSPTCSGASSTGGAWASPPRSCSPPPRRSGTTAASAYPYTVLASGSVGLAILAVRYWRGGWPHPMLLGLLYGLRRLPLDLLLFLAPLLAVAHLAHCRRTGRRRRPAGPTARRGRRRAALARAHRLAVGGPGDVPAADAAPGPVRRRQLLPVVAGLAGASSPTAGKCSSTPGRGCCSPRCPSPTGSAAGSSAGGARVVRRRPGPRRRPRSCS